MRYTVLVVLAVLSVAGCTAQAPAPGPSSQPQARPGQEVVVPEQARLEAAAKQYAPGGDRRRCLRAARRTRGRRSPGWSRPAGSWTRCSSARCGAATKRCCSTCSRDNSGARDRRDCTTSSSTRDRGTGSITTSRSSPGAPPKPEGANFYPGRRDEGRSGGVDEDAARGAARRGEPASSPRSGASPGQAGFVAVPYSQEYQGELALRGRAPARGGGAHHASQR